MDDRIESKTTSAETSEYVGPHYYHHLRYDSLDLPSETQWDSLHGIDQYTAHVTGAVRGPGQKVFAWHLHSTGSAYESYDFALLWAVSYFSYHIDPSTGGYQSIHDWKTTDLVTDAHNKGCKVLLSITNFGVADNKAFLDHSARWQTLADSLVVLLDARDADGINIDFEGIPPGYTHQFSQCINFLSQKLKSHHPQLLTTVALYAIDYHGVFDILAIDDAVDYYTLMSYDYYGGFSKIAGPVSPLTSSAVFGEHSVETSVRYYLDAGVRPSKFIVGVAYYGAAWQTESKAIPSPAKTFIEHPTYQFIQTVYIDSLKLKFTIDQNSASSVGIYEDAHGDIFQIWYDNHTTLTKKYEWIKRQKLAGVGIWVPAYAHAEQSLWDLLAEFYGTREE